MQCPWDGKHKYILWWLLKKNPVFPLMSSFNIDKINPFFFILSPIIWLIRSLRPSSSQPWHGLAFVFPCFCLCAFCFHNFRLTTGFLVSDMAHDIGDFGACGLRNIVDGLLFETKLNLGHTGWSEILSFAGQACSILRIQQWNKPQHSWEMCGFPMAVKEKKVLNSIFSYYPLARWEHCALKQHIWIKWAGKEERSSASCPLNVCLLLPLFFLLHPQP